MLDEAMRATAFMPMAAFGALAKESGGGKERRRRCWGKREMEARASSGT